MFTRPDNNPSDLKRYDINREGFVNSLILSPKDKELPKYR